MNAKELKSHLVFHATARGRFFEPETFRGWKGFGHFYLPLIVRRIGEGLAEVCPGAKVGYVADGRRAARILVDDGSRSSVVRMRLDRGTVEVRQQTYWTQAPGVVDRLVAVLCEIVSERLAPTY